MKYLCLNDFLYLLRKKYLLLILIFTLPLFFLLFRMNINENVIDIVMFVTGTNLKYRSSLEVIIFLFNCASTIYLIFYLYTKDLTNQLENIFLRVTQRKYILIKNLLCTATLIIIKIIEYLLIYLVVFKRVEVRDYLTLLLSDTTYIIFIQYISLLLYLCYLTLKRNIFIITPILILVFLLIPKNIISIKSYLLIVLALIIILYFITYLIFNQNIKKILENL